VAVIGLAGRFPGARNVDEFWRNLCGGVESIRRFSPGELRAAGVAPALAAHPLFVPAGGVLEDAGLCDAGLFQLTPREASLLDPQHRQLLECAWEALEDAGCDPARFGGPVGVFAGAGLNGYLLHNLIPAGELAAAGGDAQVAIASEKDFLATRISYKLNLTGPSLDVQTACSTSLVAVVLACQSLLNYQCDLALAGGVAVRQPQHGGYLHQEHGILSPDGHCRPFDAAARGTVPGSGAGLVVLRRLEDALADRDTIRAVIRGAAVNNDGAAKVGYTAPSVQGQAEVIGLALAVAGIRPRDVSFIETHGTATPLGDPIELRALDRVFRADSAERGFCTLGAVKSNVGHLDTAAGVAGLIKTVLALERRQIPPTLHFTAPNPEIDLAATAFRINGALLPWDTDRLPRRAGVSSFGIGGTNAHVVLEEAPAPGGGGAAAAGADAAAGGEVPDVGGPGGEAAGGRAPGVEAPEAGTGNGPRPELLILSARTQAALDAMTLRLAGHLHERSGLPLADVARTLSVGRRQLAARRILVARDLDDAAAALVSGEPGRMLSSHHAAAALADAGSPGTPALGGGAPEVAFLFPGQGAQHAGMAAELHRREPVFRRELERCCELLRPHLETDLLPLLTAGRRGHGGHGEKDEAGGESGAVVVGERGGERGLAATELAQPALFAVEYALARLWMSWGVRPAAMLGHSVGEYVAACLAGVMPLDRALELVARRGRLMQSLPPGAMLAVPLGEAEVAPLLGPDLTVAAVNAPDRVVVAGPPAAAARLAEQLAARGIGTRELAVGHAFHSPEVAALLPAWEAELGRTPLAPPEIPYLSTLTGTWATAGQATSAAAWAEHLRAPARLAAALGELLSDPNRVLLEVGPGQSLTSLARRQRPGPAAAASGDPGRAAGNARAILASLPGRDGLAGDLAFLLGTVGKLWLAGAEIDWTAFQAGRGRRVPLPTYPFERQSYWITPEPASRRAAAAATRGGEPEVSLGWPVWRPALPHRGAGRGEPETWLLLIDDAALGAGLAQHLVQPRQGEPPPRAVLLGIAGARFSRLSDSTYRFDPLAAADHDALIAAAASPAGGPLAVVHLLGLDGADGAEEGTAPVSGGAAGAEAGPRAAAGEVPAAAAREARAALRSLAHLAAALARRSGGGGARIEVVTRGAVDLGSGSGVAPEQAALRGLCAAMAAAHPAIACRLVDVTVPPGAAATPQEQRRWLDRLLYEIGAPPVAAGPAPAPPRAAPARSTPPGEDAPAAPPAAAGGPSAGALRGDRAQWTAAGLAVALRGRQRWTEGWEPLPAGFWSSEESPGEPAPAAGAAPVTPLGYLVAAGDEELAARLAEALARQPGAHVAVVSTPLGGKPPLESAAGGAAASGRWPDDAWLEEREAALLAAEERAAGVSDPAPGAASGSAAGSCASPATGAGAAAPEAAATAALDALCTSAIVRYLGAAGIRVERGSALGWHDLRQRLRLVPRGERLLRRLLSFLEEDGVIAAAVAPGDGGDRAGDGGVVRFTRDAAELGTVAERRRALEQELPQLAGVCALIDHCTGQYPRALAGEMEGLEVLYPGGSPELLESAVRAGEAAAAADLAPALLRELLAAAVSGTAVPFAGTAVTAVGGAGSAGGTGERPLRILEVGAGQGVLTRELLPVLAGRPVDYHFTDIGRAFVLRAEERAATAGQTFQRFGVLDIARDPLAQGFPAAGYDVVLGANVVHATPRIADTLRHLTSLLAPGGLLALVETVRQRRWGDMVWGLTDGWWSFADAELRQLSPLLGAAQWVEQLGRAGLAGAGAWPRTAAARERSDSALLLARRPPVPEAAFAGEAAAEVETGAGMGTAAGMEAAAWAGAATGPERAVGMEAAAGPGAATGLEGAARQGAVVETGPAAAPAAAGILHLALSSAAPQDPAALAAQVAAAGSALPPITAVIWAGGAAAGWEEGPPPGLAGAAALAEQLAQLPRPPAIYVLCSTGPGPRPYLEALAERLADREDVAGACVSLHAGQGAEEDLPAALVRLLAAQRAGEPLPGSLELRRTAALVSEKQAPALHQAGDAGVAGDARDDGRGRAQGSVSSGQPVDAASAGHARDAASTGPGGARGAGNAGRAAEPMDGDGAARGGGGARGGAAERREEAEQAADGARAGAPAGGARGTMLMHARPQLLVPYAAPRDPAEERIAAIWSRALGISPIGIHDNFMELGGDSLTGLRVMREIGEAFDLDGRGLSLYETPTVATIAAALTGGGDETLIARRESRGQRRRELRQGARRNS
jgi:phthiocerol/phenolphthiocerol synthesis type-I polyketide synthase E